MPNLRCPQCRTVTTFEAGDDPVCPRCGYGAAPAQAEEYEDAPSADAAPTPGVSAGTAAATQRAPVQRPQGGYGQGPRTDGGAVAALVLGIVGLVFIPLIPSIIAWALGAQAVRRCDEDPDLEGRSMAMVGMVLGIVGVALVLLFLFFMFVFFGAIASAAR